MRGLLMISTPRVVQDIANVEWGPVPPLGEGLHINCDVEGSLTKGGRDPYDQSSALDLFAEVHLVTR
jgi:hypothetical protein